MLDEIVIYHPPKSTSFGHAASRRNKNLAWKETSAFLNKFTNYELCSWIVPDIQYWERESVDGPRLSPESYLSLRNILGKPDNESPFIKKWAIPQDKLDAVIKISLEKRNTKPIDPIHLHFAYSFNWKSFESKEEELRVFLNSKRIHQSSITIYIGHNLFFQPHLYFPYNYTDKSLREFIKQIKLYAPFKIKNKYFKRMIKTKKGKYLWRNLSDDWTEA